MAETYTELSLADARSALASLLGDPNQVFFQGAHLDSCLKESISTFVSATLLHRERQTFNAPAGKAFVDLPVNLSGLTPSVTDRSLINTLCLDLMETQIVTWASGWAGTEQFTLEQITGAIERRRDEFLLLSGMILTERDNYAVTSPRVALPDSVGDVRRVAWKTFEGKYKPLTREDEFSLTAFSRTWANAPSIPKSYSTVSVPSQALQLAPPPNDIGTLHLLTSDAGVGLTPTTTETTLGVPEHFWWVLKWGVLSDLLSPSTLAGARILAQYAEMRWREGVQLARLHVPLLNIELIGIPTELGSVSEWDDYRVNWQNVSGTSKQVALASWNLLALYPTPLAGNEVSVTADVVRNPILPASDTEHLQIDRPYLDTVLEYARHLALFKCGADDVIQSKNGYDRLIKTAALHNDRLRAQGANFSSLTDSISTERERKSSGLNRRTQTQEEEAA